MTEARNFYNGKPFRVVHEEIAKKGHICGACGTAYRKNKTVVLCRYYQTQGYFYMHVKCAARHPQNIENLSKKPVLSTLQAATVWVMQDIYEQNPTVKLRPEVVAQHLGVPPDNLASEFSRLTNVIGALESFNTPNPSGKKQPWFKYRYDPRFPMDFKVSDRHGCYHGPLPPPRLVVPVQVPHKDWKKW